MARHELTEDSSADTAMTFAELYRHGSEWKLHAAWQGRQGKLKAVCDDYGLNIN